jgi:hypothetical protein
MKLFIPSHFKAMDADMTIIRDFTITYLDGMFCLRKFAFQHLRKKMISLPIITFAHPIFAGSEHIWERFFT